MVFSSPRSWPESDCKFLEQKLLEQGKTQTNYPFTEKDEKKLKTSKIRIGSQKEIVVSVPEDDDNNITEQSETTTSNEQRDSIKVQAKLSVIGEKLGFKIWIPRVDRNRVLEFGNQKKDRSLKNYH